MEYTDSVCIKALFIKLLIKLLFDLLIECISGTLKKKETEHRIKLREQKIVWDEQQKIQKARDNRSMTLLLSINSNELVEYSNI